MSAMSAMNGMGAVNAPESAAAQWTRATGTGVDPHECRRVIAGLASVAD
ncbi:hypothetical protein [Streptomyces sp. NPDC001404]